MAWLTADRHVFSDVHRPYPSNKYIRVPCGNNVGLNVVPIWVSPAGCLLRLLKVFSWDLYGLRDEAA